jgi:ABC-type branched-subunit amino acid transport system substrate-binding protein
MGKFRLATVVTGLSLGLLAAPVESQGVVKIGVIGPFTGPSASSGIAMRKSFELAQEEFNTKGGELIDGSRKTVQFLFEDTQSKPEVGISAAQKLLTRDSVEVMLAELLNSSVALAVMELAPSYPNVLFMSGQPVSIEIAKRIERDPAKYQNFWKFDFNSDALAHSVHQTIVMLERDGQLKPRTRSIAFVAEDTDFARSNMEYIAPLFKTDGWNVSLVETVQIGHSDFYPQLSKVRAAQPDVIVSIFTAASSGIAFVRQLKEMRITVPHIANYYPSLSEFTKGAGGSAEGLIYTPYLFDPKYNPDHKQVAEKLTRYTNVPAQMDHAFGLCNAEVLLDAVRRAQSVKVAALNSALAKTDYRCGLGHWVFNPTKRTPLVGEGYLQLPAAQIQGGEFRTIWPVGAGSVSYKAN